MTRVAAIDCGTNSIRLLVADVDPTAGTLVDVDRRSEVVRLGQGVDRTGRLAPEALERTLDASARYARICDELGVSTIRFVATSAGRAPPPPRLNETATKRLKLVVDPCELRIDDKIAMTPADFKDLPDRRAEIEVRIKPGAIKILCSRPG